MGPGKQVTVRACVQALLPYFRTQFQDHHFKARRKNKPLRLKLCLNKCVYAGICFNKHVENQSGHFRLSVAQSRARNKFTHHMDGLLFALADVPCRTHFTLTSEQRERDSLLTEPCVTR